MTIRRPRPEEFERLRELHEQQSSHFAFPNIDIISSIYVVCDDDGIIVGFGILQPIFESIVVLDQNENIGDRIDAFNQLLTRAEEEMKEQGINEIHAFVQDKKFANLLKKRKGFKNTRGEALVKVVK